MPIRYDDAVPWGRSFSEYQHMFSLSETDLGRKILGCGDGPASFNARMNSRGQRVVSCDPLYQFTSQQIQQRIDVTYETVIEQTRLNAGKFVWDSIPSVEELGRVRMAAMADFLADYPRGMVEGRYVAAELPDLPFADHTFDLALCSHFLFLYSDHFSLDFHQQAVEAMCRVAGEVRIFPILDYNANRSIHVDPLLDRLSQSGHNVSIETVDYEFQRGGNQTMRVCRFQ